MTLTMMVLGFIAMGVAGFILGQHCASSAVSNKIKEVKVTVDYVINTLQLKLILDNDHRGFHTRTQVIEWLKNAGPEVQEEFNSRADHGRKTL